MYSAHMWDFKKGAAFLACLFARVSSDVHVSPHADSAVSSLEGRETEKETKKCIPLL